MTDTIRQVDVSDITAPEDEPEPLVESIVVPVKRLVFDGHQHFQDYKDYLGTLVGESVRATVSVTHIVSELNGYLVTRSTPIDLHSAQVQILGTNGSYITFQCGDGEEEPAIHTTQAAFFDIEYEGKEQMITG